MAPEPAPAPALALEIELAGLANGVPVEVMGSGEVAGGRVRVAVRLPGGPVALAFDPALVVLGLLDVLALLGQVGETEGPVYVGARMDLYDEHGRDAGGWRVLAEATREGGTLRLAGILRDHATHLEPGELVRGVEPWTVVAQHLEPGGVLLAGAWHVETGRGNGYRGVSVAAVDGLPPPATALWFGAVQVRRDEGLARVEVNVTAEERGHAG